MKIGCNIRRLREIAGLSQVELAKMASINSTQLSHFECNRRQPNLTNFVAIAHALHVSTSSLLFGEEFDSGLDLRGVKEADKHLLFQLANRLRVKPIFPKKSDIAIHVDIDKWNLQNRF